MTAIDSAPTLEDRIRELEAENARLAAEIPPPQKVKKKGRWRAFTSALLIVIASILVPISIITGWARLQLVNEEAFVNTLAPLVDDPAVQQLVIDEAVSAINEQVDFDEITTNVFDGIAELGLPPRAEQALGLLQGPAADGLRNLVNGAVTKVVESDAFSDVWATTTRAAHRALTTAATSDGGGLVVRTDDGVGIQLGAIVERVKQNLTDQGVAVAQFIPTIDRVIIIGEGNNLAAIRAGYAVATAVGFWLPFVTIALFALGILIARRRSVAVLGTGIGFAIGAGALAMTFTIGSTVVGMVGADLDISPAGLDVIYHQLIDSMAQTAAVLAVLGVVIAAIGWLIGGSGPARGIRNATDGLNASIRKQLAARGLDTGAFGEWLGRNRVLVRVVVAVLAVLWLFALRPISFGEILLVGVVALVVAWVLELLQRRAEEMIVSDVAEDEPLADPGAPDEDPDGLADTAVLPDPVEPTVSR